MTRHDAFVASAPARSSAGSNVVPLGCHARVLLNEPVHLWRKEVLGRLEELVQLEHGWDGYHAPPVSFDVAQFALRMLESACAVDAPCPQIVPGTAGDLQIEWHSILGQIELHVRAPNDVHAWRTNAMTGVGGEELELTVDFIVVAKWIRELSEPESAARAAAA